MVGAGLQGSDGEVDGGEGRRGVEFAKIGAVALGLVGGGVVPD